MLSKKLTKTVISNKYAHPREVTGVSVREVINPFVGLKFICMCTDEVIGVSAVDVDMDSIEIFAVTTVGIGLDFIVRVASAVKVLGAAGAGVGVGADVRVSGVAAVMTALDFPVPALLEGSLLSCRTSFSCWPMTVLDCAHALQACMPSCHV